MPWYHIYASHGPGHQSSSGYYRWYDEKLSPDEEKEIFEDLFRGCDWPIGKVVLLKALPVDIKQSKIAEFTVRKKEVVEQCDKLLKILAVTPAKGCAHIRTKWDNGKVFPLSVTECLTCRKVQIYGYPDWIKKPKNLAQVATYEALKKFNQRRKEKHGN